MTSLRMSALYGRSLVRMPARRTMPSTLDMRYKARWDRVPEFWVWRSDKMFRYALPYFARRGACRTSLELFWVPFRVGQERTYDNDSCEGP